MGRRRLFAGFLLALGAALLQACAGGAGLQTPGPETGPRSGSLSGSTPSPVLDPPGVLPTAEDTAQAPTNAAAAPARTASAVGTQEGKATALPPTADATFEPAQAISAANAARLAVWKSLEAAGEKLAFSSDGRFLGVGTYRLQLFSLPDLKHVRTVEAPYSPVFFSSNLDRLAYVEVDQGDFIPKLRLFDALTGEAGRFLLAVEGPGPNEWIDVIGFSPDGGKLAARAFGSGEPAIHLYRVEDGRLLCSLRAKNELGFIEWLEDIAFDPTGRRVAGVGKDGVLRVFDGTTCLQQTALRERPVHDYGFSPDGGAIVLPGDWDWNTVLIETAGGRVAGILKTAPQIVHRAAFSPDGALLALSIHDQIELWSAASGARLAGRPAPGETVAMAFSPDGYLLATSHVGGLLLLWAVP